MLKEITLKNFQSHKRTKINLSPHVNILTGISRSGKTAIIRAIRLITFLRPIGFRYKSHFAEGKASEIHLNFTDGKYIELKHKKKLEYHTSESNEPYRAFGSKQPDEISQLINLDATNFSFQFTKGFLVDSPTEIAREINSITNQDKIISLIKVANKKISECNTRLEMLEGEKKDTDRTIRALHPLRGLRSEIIRAKRNLKKLDEMEIKISNVKEAKETYLKTKTDIEGVRRQIQVLTKLKISVEAFSEEAYMINMKREACKQVVAIRESIELVKKKIRKQKKKYISRITSTEKCPWCFNTIDKEMVKNELFARE